MTDLPPAGRRAELRAAIRRDRRDISIRAVLSRGGARTAERAPQG